MISMLNKIQEMMRNQTISYKAFLKAVELTQDASL